MRTTDAGAMRDVIRIEQRSTEQDAAGEQVPTWALVAERYAEKTETPGTEGWSSRERIARVPTSFRMRWPSFTVRPDMRVIHKGRVYNVLSAIDETGVSKDLLLTCEEVVSEPTS
jgi:head-tail adaptor